MSQRSDGRFEFGPGIPLSGVEPGTNVLVSGPSGQGARDVALRLVADGASRNEGALLVSADVSGRALLERCEESVPRLDRSRLGIVDCAGLDSDEQRRFESRVASIADPGDLSGIELELSVLYETIAESGVDGVRLGVFSVSSMLAHADLQSVSRFVHMLTGRVIATEDFGVFLVDATALDERAVDTIAQFCDGRIEVRSDDRDGYELRVDGLDAQPEAWTSVTLEP